MILVSGGLHDSGCAVRLAVGRSGVPRTSEAATPTTRTPDPDDEVVDEAGDESFPASDPPSFAVVTGTVAEPIEPSAVRKAQRDRAVTGTKPKA